MHIKNSPKSVFITLHEKATGDFRAVANWIDAQAEHATVWNHYFKEQNDFYLLKIEIQDFFRLQWHYHIKVKEINLESIICE